MSSDHALVLCHDFDNQAPKSLFAHIHSFKSKTLAVGIEDNHGALANVHTNSLPD